MPTADHEIDIKLEKHADGILHAVPKNIPLPMFVGETVHYRSWDGEVSIEFNDLDLSDARSPCHSPFLDPNGNELRVVKSTDDPTKLSNRGIFFGHCFVTP